MTDRPKVILRQGRDHSVRSFHPWVFSGAIADIQGEVSDGTVVDLHSSGQDYLATGHYSPGSIAVRVFSFTPVISERDLLQERLSCAFAWRKSLGLVNSRDTNAFRLFNTEGDGIPGLVIDYYNGAVVIQCHSAGTALWRELIIDVLRELLGPSLRTVYERSPENEESLKTSAAAAPLYGKAEPVLIKENNLTFEVDYLTGQKTGFFLDQRQNRAYLQQFSSGRQVLNAFCYTGAFSAYALRGGAAAVHSVDISQNSLDCCIRNVERNAPAASHQTTCADCLQYLQTIGDAYDLIILDPPAFVKHQGALKGGIRGYETINYHAIRQIASNGLIFTFSCSQFVDRALFRQTIAKAAARTKRSVSILAEFRQAPCHPVSLYHPEGDYLKGLLLAVR